MPSPVTMQGPRRKIVHATLYEVIAVGIVTLVMEAASDTGPGHALGLGVSTSVLGLSWNIVFNTLFERWEQRQPSRERTVHRRIVHAVGFEGGLTLMTVPLIAWWMQMGLWGAVIADLGLVGLFIVYTCLFNWAFDQVFGLPVDAARHGLDG